MTPPEGRPAPLSRQRKDPRLAEDHEPIKAVPEAARKAWERKHKTPRAAAEEALRRYRERKGK